MKQRIIFSVLMSFMLSSLMTGWVTWINLGWNVNFFTQWLTAFLSALPAAALISMLSGPEIHRLSAYLANPSLKGKG